MTPWQWAEEHVTNPINSTRWSSRDSTWLRPIMEAIADESVRNVTCMCSAQSGKTLTVLAILAWIIAEEPGPILWVTKNEDEAKKIAKSRLMPLLELCGPVAERMPTNRSEKMTCEIYFPGAPLIIASAENKAALQSTPFKYLLLDEVRSYPDGALEMVSKRTRSYAYTYKKIIISTPDMEGDALHREYLDGSQGVYHVKCPKCGCEQPLEWRDHDSVGGLKWDSNEITKPNGEYDVDKVVETVRWECEACDYRCRDNQKERKELSNSGRWIERNKKAPSDTKSYHWGALLPWWPSWGHQVKEKLKAYKAMKWGDHEPMKSFVTETEGRPWTDQIRWKNDEKYLEARRHDYDPKDFFDWEKRRFMTVDVQGAGGRHFYYVVRAWGYGAVSRKLCSGKCWTLEELLQLAREWNVPQTNIIMDSGHWATEVYRYCVDSQYQIKPVKDEDKEFFTEKGRRVLAIASQVDPASGTAMKGRVRMLKLWLIAKYGCLDRLAMLMGGQMGDWQWSDRFCHEDYAKQVTAYDRRDRLGRDGVVRQEWFSKRKDNHLASCELYQVGIASLFGFLYSKEEADKQQQTAPAPDA